MYTQTYSTCKDSRFIEVHSVPYCSDSWYTNRSVLCFTAEDPRRTESNSTACLQKTRRHPQKPQWNEAHVLIHWSQSLQFHGGRWNDNKFDTAPLKIWLTILIYFSLDQTTWDANENCKDTMLFSTVFSCGGALTPSHQPKEDVFHLLFSVAVSNSIT